MPLKMLEKGIFRAWHTSGAVGTIVCEYRESLESLFDIILYHHAIDRLSNSTHKKAEPMPDERLTYRTPLTPLVILGANSRI